jgi:YVTN family beta-propeller protein
MKKLVIVALASALLFAVFGQATAHSAGRSVDRSGEIGPAFLLTANGRHLQPAGRMTEVGDFPTGGALTHDGRFFWAVDSGHGKDGVHVVNVATGAVVQVLPLPGAYGGIAFNPSGTIAYVSGEPRGDQIPYGPTRADAGDAVHVFSVNAATGRGTEQQPIVLPPTAPNKLGWPEGLTVTPDGATLLVALNQANKVAVINLQNSSHPTQLIPVGRFPYSVAVERHGRNAYVSNELDGTISVVDLATHVVSASIGVGGARGNLEAHPEALIDDPTRDVVYAAVTNRDSVVAIDTTSQSVVHTASVERPEGIGSAPLALAESPDGHDLYVADSGEDAVAVIHLGAGHGARGIDFGVIGKIPTAAYPAAVAVTPDGARLVWLAAKGLGAGPNPSYGAHWANSEAAPYGSYVIDKLNGEVGVLDRPRDAELPQFTAAADAQVRPANFRKVPPSSPVVGPHGGPSGEITHVFYVVRENRTYDQVFGSEPRGDGDPALEVVDDNGAPGPAGGITPNAHALSRQFPLLDHVYADSEVSTDGHVITSSSYAIDFVEKALHADYSGRGRDNNAGRGPETYPPNAFVFDQAVRQRVSFDNFGEFAGGLSDDGRPTYPAVHAGQDFGYPFHFGCDGTYPNLQCSTDAGHPGQLGDPKTSRFDYFQRQFNAWTAGGADHVPSFVYLTLPNDHTNGVSAGHPTPQAMIADNDLGLGQLVQLISHNAKVWAHSAIFVVEDDSQDGADHVDAHRMPAFVISPYAAHQSVVHTRYDQYSVLRTAELILGLHPLSLFDALATPMDGAFTNHPDFTPYSAIQPTQNLGARNPVLSAFVPNLLGGRAQELAARLPFDQVDLVPQELSDAVLWQSVYGWAATPPPPGPGASSTERARATVALSAFAEGRDIATALQTLSPDDEGSNDS